MLVRAPLWHTQAFSTVIYGSAASFPPSARQYLLKSSTLSRRWLSTPSSRPNSPPPPKRRRLLLSTTAALLIAGGTYYYQLDRSSSSRLSPYYFTPLTLVGKTALTAETSVFRLAIPESTLPLLDDEGVDDAATKGRIWSVFVMQPDLQIQRAYTPLDASCFRPSAKGEGTREIELLVKKYENGELSRWLHGLRDGGEVRVRGPVVTWDVLSSREGERPVEEVVFIVGGTGITPAYQFIQSHFSSSSSTTSASLGNLKISLIFSSPSPSQILLKTQLDALASQHPQKLSVKYLVDKKEGWLSKLDQGVSVDLVNAKIVEKGVGRGGVVDGTRRVVVVCGPEGMVNHVAGPRTRDLSQGPVGGVLGSLGYREDEVIKL